MSFFCRRMVFRLHNSTRQLTWFITCECLCGRSRVSSFCWVDRRGAERVQSNYQSIPWVLLIAWHKTQRAFWCACFLPGRKNISQDTGLSHSRVYASHKHLSRDRWLPSLWVLLRLFCWMGLQQESTGLSSNEPVF